MSRKFYTQFQRSVGPIRDQKRTLALHQAPGEGHCYWSLLSRPLGPRNGEEKRGHESQGPPLRGSSPQSRESSVSEHRHTLHVEATHLVRLAHAGAGTLSCDLGDLISSNLLFVK